MARFGPRARARTSLPRSASAERSSPLKARALYITERYVPLRPGILACGSTAARLDGLAAHEGAVMRRAVRHDSSTAPAGPTPRQHDQTYSLEADGFAWASTITVRIFVPCSRFT